MNTTIETTETTAMILRGSGYELTIAPDALAAKQQLIEGAAAITAVADNDQSMTAQYHVRQLAAMRIAVEKSRTAVKAPVNRIGKLIDQTAKDFLVEIVAEEKRISDLVGQHAAEVARIKAQREAEERRIAEEARRAREEAERAAEAAASSGKISDILAAKQAEKERQELLAARMQAADETAAAKDAGGVRFAWDFEIDNLVEVFKAAPELCSLEIKRAAVLAWFRELEAADEDVAARAALVGIAAFKKPVVSTR